MSLTPQAPDAEQLAGEKLGAAPFPGRIGGLRVYFDQTVHDAITRHGSENTTVEICGVLVGAWKQDESGPYVHVSASIRGDAASNKFTEVTFTHETWSKINERMDKEFTDRVIVGWYHTHPDFGVFLSDRDVFIHQHFFSAPGQIALVVDPVRREEGVFTWKSGKPQLAPTHWVGPDQRWSPRVSASGMPEHTRSEAAGPNTYAAHSAPPARSSSALLLAAAVGLFACGFLIARYGQRQEHYLIAEALAEQLSNRTYSPETKRSMQDIRALLSEIGDESRKLTEPKKDGADAPKPEQISAAIIEKISRASKQIDQAIAATALRPEQQYAIDKLVLQRLQSAVEQNIQELVSRGVLTVNKPADGGTPATKPGTNAAAPGTPPTGPSTTPSNTPPTGPSTAPSNTPPAGPSTAPSNTPPTGPSTAPSTPPTGPSTTPSTQPTTPPPPPPPPLAAEPTTGGN